MYVTYVHRALKLQVALPYPQVSPLLYQNLNLMPKIIALLLLSSLTLSASWAQPTEESFRAAQARVAREQIQTLHEDGVLVVRIATDHRKIQILERLVRDHPSNARHRKQLTRALALRDSTLRATLDAYDQHYTFSRVLFMPDTAARSLLRDGITSGIFYNAAGQIDPNIQLDTEDFFLSYIGTPPLSSSSGKRSVLIATRRNQVLEAPFPYATKLYTLFQTLTGREDYEVIHSAIERQQQDLEKFYERAIK